MKVCALVLLTAAAAPLAASDWPQWLGPNRNGKSAETGLLRAWPEGGPELLWEVDSLGKGYASLAVADGRIYTQGQLAVDRPFPRHFLMALDAATGETLWHTPNHQPYRDDYDLGDGPRSAPTLDGDRLYALSASGYLICANAETGDEIWNVNLFERFDGRQLVWGISESPLIDGDRVIVHASGGEGGLVALDKQTGETVWHAEPGRAGYASPVVVEVGGVRQYITLDAAGGLGVRAEDGTVLWRYPRVSNQTANIATPIVHDGHVFLSTAYGTGGALLRLTPTGFEEVYFTRDMKNHYTTSVLVGDYLYGYNNSILTCMNFKTGEIAWRDRSVGKGQIIYADGLLFLLSEDGTVGLAEATPDEYRELSRFSIGEVEQKSWSLPVIADGRLYIRDQGKLRCYRISEE